MIPEDELEIGELRLLEVDNRVVLPVNTHVRVLVTAADVLHSFAVPSLGIKLDACTGRLNQTTRNTVLNELMKVLSKDVINFLANEQLRWRNCLQEEKEHPDRIASEYAHDEQIFSEYEASKAAQKRRGHTNGWAII